MDVPEFSAPTWTGSRLIVDFPKAKYKPSDQTKDPAKYAKLVQEYLDAIHHFIDVNPQTKEGMDLDLADIDPGANGTRLPRTHARNSRQVLVLAQSKYLVARADTDLQGQGSLPFRPASIGSARST